MVEAETAAQLSKVSIQLSAVFTVVGIALLYLAIAISDASNEIKVLWASGLSLGVAFLFLVIWTMARDAVRSHERELRRKLSP